jgi:hypothetical protein
VTGEVVEFDWVGIGFALAHHCTGRQGFTLMAA